MVWFILYTVCAAFSYGAFAALVPNSAVSSTIAALVWPFAWAAIVGYAIFSGGRS